MVLAGFHKDLKDKVGALFWRSHRCARIIFSLKYEMGEMTAAVCWLAIIAVIDHRSGALHLCMFDSGEWQFAETDNRYCCKLL
eukprot:COSAG02_NODE_3314_length_6953_cov_4.605924_4_plen_83_part_00